MPVSARLEATPRQRPQPSRDRHSLRRIASFSSRGQVAVLWQLADASRRLVRSLLLQEFVHLARHRLTVVKVRQDERVAEAIAPEPALIQHLPGGEGAAAG